MLLKKQWRSSLDLHDMMTILRVPISFLNRQMNQIFAGGRSVLYKKIKRFFWLFFMHVAAPLAVHFKMNWTKAYEFAGKKSIKKLKKLHAQTNPSELTVERTRGQAIKYFKAIVDRGPGSTLADKGNWIEACRVLGALYFHPGKMKEMSGVFQKEAEVLQDTAAGHHFDDLGIEFLPRYLPVGSIGNYEALEVYIKVQRLGLHPAKKLILLMDPQALVNNPCYLDYWRRYITVISDPLLVEMLAPLEKWLTIPLNLYMFLGRKVHKSFLAFGAVREQWAKEERPPLLTLSDEDYDRGWKSLKSLGMNQGDWFVCLHVRERGWRGDHSSVEDFRNADINTYQLAIKVITEAGGWVIRMGDPAMQPLPQMPRVIDYAHSEAKSDWMDVFLCAQCRFFIGTSSGLFNFAKAFGNPVAMTNILPSCVAYYFSRDDLFIPRICWLKDKNRFLTFAELFSPPIGTAAIQCIYSHKHMEIRENSAEEIKDLVEEMLDRCNGHLRYSEEDEALQKRFKLMTFDCGEGYGEERPIVHARLGQKFLRRYENLLPFESRMECPKTAVIGATGFIGNAFFTEYRKLHHDCTGTSRDVHRNDMSFLDLSCPKVASLELAETGHREALILTAISKVADCEKDKKLTRRINVEGTLELIKQLVKYGIKPIFLSSDIVFDGITGHYDESVLPHPLNEYGRQKLEVELRMKEICPDGNYLIVRISKVFSLNKGDGTLFDEMATTLKAGGTVRAAYDQMFSPIYISDLVKLVMILQKNGATGVIHINPPEVWSRYDLALTLADCMGVNSSYIERISLDDLRENFKRPKNTTMKVDKVIRETGYMFTPTIKYIENIAKNWTANGTKREEIKV